MVNLSKKEVNSEISIENSVSRCSPVRNGRCDGISYQEVGIRTQGSSDHKLLYRTSNQRDF